MDRNKALKVMRMKNLVYSANWDEYDDEIAEMMHWEACLKRDADTRANMGFLNTVFPGRRFPIKKGTRAFPTMQEYRKWCEKTYPRWMGYKRVR